MATKKGNEASDKSSESRKTKRSRISQSDIPSLSLHEAIRIPQAIVDSYAAKPAAPLRVAQAVEMTPTSGPFRALTGAAIAYGLTEGAAQGSSISLTELGLRACRPTAEGMRETALREALLRPRLIGDFLRRYDQNRLPPANIAANVLIEMGAPQDRANDVYETIVVEARKVGFLADVGGKPFVDLRSTLSLDSDTTLELSTEPTGEVDDLASEESENSGTASHALAATQVEDTAKRRYVFITHGKNKKFVEPLKKILAFGEMEAKVAIQEDTTSIGIPEKIM